MLNVSKLIRQLKKEREQTRAKLEQLDSALKVLGDVGNSGRRGGRGGRTSGTRRPMSAAAKKRIATAQRARWAKWRTARKNK